MARKSSTKTENPTEQIMNALDTPLNLEWVATAEKLSIPVPELQERVSAKLNDCTVFAWDNLPIKHEPLVEAIKRDLHSEASVRTLAPETPPEAPAQPEIPVMVEEPKPVAKKGKSKSSALTNKKTEAIAGTKEETKQTSIGISETLTLLQAQEAVVDSSQDATAYLTTYATNLTNLKGEGLAYFASQSLQKISNSSGFNPQEIMQQVGVTLSAETQAKLNETMGQVLGKSQAAAQEIQETAWGNGYNLPAELLNLENLMNSED